MNFRSLVLLALMPVAALPAQVVLPTILTSHMVIQRDLPVHVWGMATPGQGVTVTFRGETRTTQAGALGRWSLYLKPGAAGGPFQLSVKGEPVAASAAPEQPITLDDILVGDIWVASGQSNMEFEMHKAATAAEDLPHAANSQIRLLMIKKRSSDAAQDDADTEGWTVSTPDTAKDFSAVGWYFAREIVQREHVPVGVIDATWGGTIAESWVRLTALGEDASLAPLFVSRGKMTDQDADARLAEKEEQRAPRGSEGTRQTDSRFSLASSACQLGPRTVVERDDRAPYSTADSWRDLVSGGKQQRTGSRESLRPNHAHAD